jgi:hypothetical protein
MANFTKDIIQQVWEKAFSEGNNDSKKFRKDVCSAWIQRDKYAVEESFGWEIDHVYPESLGGNADLINLRPMQWENNRNKADNYPTYTAAKTSSNTKNIAEEKQFTVSESLQAELKKKFNVK